MELNKYSLGELIEQTTESNRDGAFGPEDVRGMTITKQIIPTKADVSSADLRKYLVIRPNDFVYNPRTHGKHIGFGFNDTNGSFLISWNNTGFRVKEEMKEVIIPEYLFFHFNRNEWDREACFRSWGSSTEVFSWESLCEMKITIPSISRQQEYVNVYKAIITNQQSYERGLEDLKESFEGLVDNLKKQKDQFKSLGQYIDMSEERNDNREYGIDSVRGISIEKRIIDTKADMTGVELKNYYLIKPRSFAYAPVTSRNGGKISIAMNDSELTYICSSSYVVFNIKDEKKLCPEYLMLYFNRGEFDRYARFHSWGSARESFDWSELCDTKIPIPDISVQKSVADIYKVYLTRKRINEQLKQQTRDICPILIRGSLVNGG